MVESNEQEVMSIGHLYRIVSVFSIFEDHYQKAQKNSTLSLFSG